MKQEMSKRHAPCIALLGASFSTGNQGVSALAECSIDLLTRQWPHAEIVLLGMDKQPTIQRRDTPEGEQKIQSLPVRFCANPFVRDHYLWLVLGLLFCRFIPYGKRITASNSGTLGLLKRLDMTADITGGDSFSDIYGNKRFLLGCLVKLLCQWAGKPFVMLPQTYGPFQSHWSKKWARRVLQNCQLIFSRDAEGIECIRNILDENAPVHKSLDVAFSLVPRMKCNREVTHVASVKENGCSVIGVNISGLLYNRGYTGENEFNLVSNYRELMPKLVQQFLRDRDVVIVLIPHVVPPSNGSQGGEDDLAACRTVLSDVASEVADRVLIMQDQYDAGEIKYTIGLCDFFVGARMHATIASLSQSIPTVGLAYSKKFAGVYREIGMQDCVVDLRRYALPDVLNKVEEIYSQRESLLQRLQASVNTKTEMLNTIFSGIEL